MDTGLLNFLLTAGLFLLVFVLLRQWVRGRSKRDRAAVPPPAPSAAPAPVPSVGLAPAPPAASAHGAHECLHRVAEQAVLFRQHVPPRLDALSYWGGVPRVPAGFEWPHFTPEGGSPRALSFIMQIDIAAIPAEGRLGVMPERGFLYFFMDLDWGVHWRCEVIHAEVPAAALGAAAVPDALPHAYGERAVWDWPQRDEDWPRLLPRFSFDPVLVRGTSLPPFHADSDDDRLVWPGSVDPVAELERVPGAIVESIHVDNRYEQGVLQRPFPSFPQDWQAVRIALGHLAEQSRRGHLDRMAARPDGLAQADALRAAITRGLATWGARADAADPALPLAPADRDAFWDFFVSVQPVSLFALTQSARDSLDATLAANPAAASVLDAQALAFARSRHALGWRGPKGVHTDTPERMLSAPSDVQGEAAERARAWLMLLELSDNPPLGHHFAEGVVQFFMRPEDLVQRRFDRVDLYASAY